VSASDLPDQRLPGHRMARALASYIDCPHRVAAEMAANDIRPPSIGTIRRYREQYLAERHRKPVESFKAHEGYHPGDAFDAAESANEAFLRRLRAAYPERFAA
jgi:hypothetical protein